jgi:hypothetical protein
MRADRPPGVFESLTAPGSRVTYAAALRELWHVHRLEQARLLREACLLLCRATPLGRLYVVARRNASRDIPPGDARSSWGEACRDEIAAARADGARVHSLLMRLSASPLDRWPLASVLARASLDLERCPAGRLDLARGLIAEGNPDEAIGILRDLLDEESLRELRVAALEALALAFESAGETRRSLAWYAATIGERRSDLRVAVSLLALALRCGDAPRVEIAARRLRPVDLSVPGTRMRFLGALRLARERIGRDRRARGGSLSETAPEIITRLALEGRGAAAEVARTLLRA